MVRKKKVVEEPVAVEEPKMETQVEETKVEDEVQDGEVIGGSEEIAEPAVKNEGETVCVCSNFPFDIKYKVPDKNGRMKDIVFNGNAGHLRGKEKGILPVGAYGITTGVPKEAWEWILKHRPDEPAIRNGNIFATTSGKARAAVRERSDVRHGFEPISKKKKG